jgi:methyl-accepting chemotaxis protein
MVLFMNETNGSSDQISKTIPATDEIAFQASLLALSAAVEAAAVRRSTETAADIARVRKRENSF